MHSDRKGCESNACQEEDPPSSLSWERCKEGRETRIVSLDSGTLSRLLRPSGEGEATKGHVG